MKASFKYLGDLVIVQDGIETTCQDDRKRQIIENMIGIEASRLGDDITQSSVSNVVNNLMKSGIIEDLQIIPTEQVI